MPAVVDSSGSRVSFKGMSEESIRTMRMKGEVSCAECRRCRIKCDRKVPCGSCRRKQCASLCPNDVLKQTVDTTNPESRPLLEEIDQLKSQVAEMTQRIRELEEGLATSHAFQSSTTHPLLKLDRQRDGGSESPDSSQPSDSDFVSAMGTLTVSNGEALYFGATACPETVLFAEGSMRQNSPPVPEPGTRWDEVLRDMQFHPLERADQLPNSFVEKLIKFLPSRTRAVELCELYLEYSWHFRPMTPEDLCEDIFALIYDNRDPLSLLQRRPHLLSNVFAILAVGAMFDPSLSTVPNPEAETYYQQARRSLNLQCTFTLAELDTVLSISHIAAYQSNTPLRELMDSSWLMTSLAIKVAEKIGLHRDPSGWNLTDNQKTRRRRLFWELAYQDWVYSLFLSRPSSVSLCHTDCEFPLEELRIGENATELVGYERLKYLMSKHIVWPVLELSTYAKAANYKTVLELDVRIRAQEIPTRLELTRQESANPTPGLRAREYVTLLCRPLCLMFIHRSFFISALMSDPLNPLGTPYAKSVVTVFCCSSFLIRNFSIYFHEFPDIFIRFWPRWTHLLSAAVILGSLAIRAPLATPSSALVDLDTVVQLYEKAAPQTPRAKAALPFLRELQAKAHYTYAKEMNKLFEDPLTDNEDTIQSVGPSSMGPEEEAVFDFKPYMDQDLLDQVSPELMLSMPSMTDIPTWDPLQPEDLSMLLSQVQAQDVSREDSLYRQPGVAVQEPELFLLPSLGPDHVFSDMDIRPF